MVLAGVNRVAEGPGGRPGPTGGLCCAFAVISIVNRAAPLTAVMLHDSLGL